MFEVWTLVGCLVEYSWQASFTLLKVARFYAQTLVVAQGGAAGMWLWMWPLPPHTTF